MDPMNLVRVEVGSRGCIMLAGRRDMAALVPDGLQARWQSAWSEGNAVWCGFRPETVIPKRGAVGLEVAISIDMVETRGAHCRIQGRWGNQSLVLVMDSFMGLKRGMEVRATLPWEEMH